MSDKVTELVEKKTYEGFSGKDMAFYEISLKVSLDNGATYVDVTSENMPASGIPLTIPYPEGTSASGYDFVVLHLLSNGSVETLAPTEKADGLLVTVKSFSPFAVAYKETKKEETGGQPAAPAQGTPSKEESQKQESAKQNEGTKADSSAADQTAAVKAPVTGDDGMTNTIWAMLLMGAGIVLAACAMRFDPGRKREQKTGDRKCIGRDKA